MTTGNQTKTYTALAVFAGIAALPFVIAWRGYVLSVLWGWFAVTTFGLPPLGVAQAIGVSLVVGYLTHQIGPKGDDGIGRAIGLGLISPAVALLIGWLLVRWAM